MNVQKVIEGYKNQIKRKKRDIQDIEKRIKELEELENGCGC